MQFNVVAVALSQFSKIVPINTAYLRYAVCGCCLCISLHVAVLFLIRTDHARNAAGDARFLCNYQLNTHSLFLLGLVIDGFLGDDALFRQGFFGCVQLIRPLFRLVNVLGKGGIGPFLGGEL